MKSEYQEKFLFFVKMVILLNLAFPILQYFFRGVQVPFFKETPAQAITSATYSEDWEAEKVMVTTPRVYWWGWWSGYVGDAHYREILGSQINSSGWAGLAYTYSNSYWSEAFKCQPHGFVTVWKVKGTLQK